MPPPPDSNRRGGGKQPNVQPIKPNSMKVLFEQFSSLAAFREAINTRPVSPLFLTAGIECSKSSSKNDTKFTATSSYDEAEALLADGWADGLRNIEKAAGGNLRPCGAAYAAKLTTEYNGFFPNMGAYLAGDPRNMYNRRKVQRPAPVVEVGILFGVHCGISADKINAGSARVLSAIATLEGRGVRCGVSLIKASATRNEAEYSLCRITVKKPTEYLDVLKLVYPLTHPSMQRRHSFRYLETLRGLSNSDWVECYGFSQPVNTIPAGYLAPHIKLLSLQSIIDNNTSIEDIIKQICA